MLKNFKPPEGENSTSRKKQIKALQEKLAVLQQQLREAKLPVIILIDGMSASGKGTVISRVSARLEPRGYKVFSAKPAVGDEARKPFLWRFWRDIPAKGGISIFERGWYLEPFEQMREHDDFDEFYTGSVNTFERQLSDDGYLILKFFLNISKEEQRDRMEDLEDSKATAWRVSDRDREQNRNYDEVLEVRSRLLELTNTDAAPWNIIYNEHENIGVYKLLKKMCEEIEKALEGKKRSCEPKIKSKNLIQMPKLSEVELDFTLTEEEYKKKLSDEQKKLSRLHSLLYREKVPVIIAFEGWDAAGKGGAIRRLSWSLDPRGFEAISVAAPTPDELAHHYLWRFWNKLPKDGHIALYDRSWYGRVMVERIEGFTAEERCIQAYNEINEFEKSLTDWGAVVLKFWVHIDKETQLARFTERQNNPEKQYKITDEDWRNREKWDVYEDVVNEMIKNTSTKKAPWIIVEGNDKKYARIKVLKEVRKALERKLE